MANTEPIVGVNDGSRYHTLNVAVKLSDETGFYPHRFGFYGNNPFAATYSRIIAFILEHHPGYEVERVSGIRGTRIDNAIDQFVTMSDISDRADRDEHMGMWTVILTRQLTPLELFNLVMSSTAAQSLTHTAPCHRLRNDIAVFDAISYEFVLSIVNFNEDQKREFERLMRNRGIGYSIVVSHNDFDLPEVYIYIKESLIMMAMLLHTDVKGILGWKDSTAPMKRIGAALLSGELHSWILRSNIPADITRDEMRVVINYTMRQGPYARSIDRSAGATSM
jgi:hypothetical protein